MIRFLLNRITALFILTMIVGAAGTLAVQYFYSIPKKQCLKDGLLWIEPGKGVPHGFARTCATPIDVRNMPILPTVPAPAGASAPASKKP